MKYIFFLTLLLIFAGCGEYDENTQVKVLGAKGQKAPHSAPVVKPLKNTTSLPKVITQKPVIAKEGVRIKLKELSSQTKIKLAEIESANKKALLEISTKENIEARKIEKELTLATQAHAQKQHTEKYAFYKIVLWVLFVLIVLILFFFLYNSKKKRETKLKMQEEDFKNKKEMKYFDAYNARVNKMLDIVSGKDVPEKTSKELIGLLKDISHEAPMLELKSNKKKRFF